MAILICLCLFLSSQVQAAETLIGGIDAKPGDFPEIVYVRSDSGSRCSATIIGPKTLLTAAHCLKDNQSLEFMMDQEVYSAKCKHHPNYADQYSYDFALCKINKKIKTKFASIGKDPVELGKKVSLTGFGCVNPRDDEGNGGDGGNDGILRWGNEFVTILPDNGVGGGQYFYTLGKVAACFGDSGSSVLELVKIPKKENHVVVGVVSRGDIRSRSLLSATYLPGFQNWAMDYALENEVEICGINKDCSKKQKPSKCCWLAKRKVEHYKKKLSKWQKKLENCE